MRQRLGRNFVSARMHTVLPSRIRDTVCPIQSVENNRKEQEPPYICFLFLCIILLIIFRRFGRPCANDTLQHRLQRPSLGRSQSYEAAGARLQRFRQLFKQQVL